MTTEKDTKRSEQQAKAQLDSITEMVAGLDQAISRDDETAREEAVTRIEEDALEVAIRTDWHIPGETGDEAEYKVLLCTGGPAVRIVGELDEHRDPTNATLEHQDWGTPWTPYPLTSDEEDTVLKYCRVFYFGA